MISLFLLFFENFYQNFLFFIITRVYFNNIKLAKLKIKLNVSPISKNLKAKTKNLYIYN